LGALVRARRLSKRKRVFDRIRAGNDRNLSGREAVQNLIRSFDFLAGFRRHGDARGFDLADFSYARSALRAAILRNLFAVVLATTVVGPDRIFARVCSD
jgi:hypothetical protein